MNEQEGFSDSAQSPRELCRIINDFIPAFYAYYKKKRDEGKPHRVAIICIARKLVRLIYKLETEHINFDLSIV